ncbi:LysR family transcriptional regulator [Raoultibacter phocaeensis]|uniref:LysR family transcriptional regulator n=1 Tax=Raoultibacter phocaeensis TaxID=2479841 RepID=UPI00111B6777|nr:LysR family transcriptional regulator [Raoultibacter phocaeensis]
MDFSYCKELIELADQLNFSKAADRLYITQSTLSKHVALMERETGFRIFDRSTARVELTKSGKIFIDSIREVVERYEAALREGRELEKEQGTTVRIIGPLLNEQIISKVITAQSKLAAEGTGVRLSLSDTGVRDCHEALLSGRTDIAVGFRYGIDEEGLEYAHIGEIPFGIACHDCHGLARKTHLGFDDIIGQKIVSYPIAGRKRYHAYVESVRRKHGIVQKIEYLEEGVLCFPDDERSIVFGIHFPGYARYGGDMIARPLDERSDVFDVCVVKRTVEDSLVIDALFEAIAAC